jgi:hypothetical protein
MTTKQSIAPDRDTLRRLFDEAVNEINQTRQDTKLTTDFYAKTGNAVFEAGYLALSDSAWAPKHPKGCMWCPHPPVAARLPSRTR